MTFKLNNISWKIKEVTKDFLNEHYKQHHDGEHGKSLYVFGLCQYPSSTIYLNKDLSPSQKRKTLMHELTHCYLWSVGMQFDKFEEEDICNVVASSHEFVLSIVNRYFKL